MEHLLGVVFAGDNKKTATPLCGGLNHGLSIWITDRMRVMPWIDDDPILLIASGGGFLSKAGVYSKNNGCQASLFKK
jgi:hypothetical protein